MTNVQIVRILWHNLLLLGKKCDTNRYSCFQCVYAFIRNRRSFSAGIKFLRKVDLGLEDIQGQNWPKKGPLKTDIWTPCLFGMPLRYEEERKRKVYNWKVPFRDKSKMQTKHKRTHRLFPLNFVR